MKLFLILSVCARPVNCVHKDGCLSFLYEVLHLVFLNGNQKNTITIYIQDLWPFISGVACCGCCFCCDSAASSVIALSNNRRLFQVRGRCWCLRHRWVLCCIISIGWILLGPPLPLLHPPTFFFYACTICSRDDVLLYPTLLSAILVNTHPVHSLRCTGSPIRVNRC